jgi:hypothetical protein
VGARKLGFFVRFHGRARSYGASISSTHLPFKVQ